MHFNIASFSAGDYIRCEKYAETLLAYVNGNGPDPGPTPLGYREVYRLKCRHAPLPEQFESIIKIRQGEAASRRDAAESAPRLAHSADAMLSEGALGVLLRAHTGIIQEVVLASSMRRNYVNEPMPMAPYQRGPYQRGPVAFAHQPNFNHARAANRDLANRIKGQMLPVPIRALHQRARRSRHNRHHRHNKKDDAKSNSSGSSDMSSTGLTTIVEDMEVVVDVEKDVAPIDEMIEATADAIADATLADDDWEQPEDNGMNMDMSNN
ncbi:hypothetical protein C8R45DRAFT_1094793 [Mycena sanguinolenta]|nr:hypothetical protein C8R45DRAFT_1094793 [Mycena sanguinolenta]